MTNLVCFVAERNRMRQQVADRSPQRHATIPTFHKILLQYYPVLQSTQAYYSALQSVLRTTKCYSSTTLYYTALLWYVTICGTQLHAVWFSHLPQIGGTQLHAVWFSHSLPQTATSYGAWVNMTSCSTHLHAANALFLHYALVVNLDTDDLPSAKPLCCSCLCFSILFSLSTGQWLVRSVLHSATPVLLCTTKYYSSTTLYYKVLLQYYSVLQSTTPVLLCTTKYYSSTTLYYTVLLQYYSVRQSYKVLIQYYSVLQSTTPVLLCTTKYYSSTTLYYTVLLQYSGYHSKFHRILRLPRKVTLALHQILRLPQKMNLMIDPWHKWNVIYNARSNMRHSPNSPNTAPATKNDRPKSQRNLLKTDETSFPMRGRSDHDPRMIRAWSEHDPTMKPSVRNPPRNRVAFHAHHEHFVLKNTTFRAPAIIPNFTEYCACHEKWHLNFTKYCACHKKWISWLILDTNETLFTMRGATCVIVQTHQTQSTPCWKDSTQNAFFNIGLRNQQKCQIYWNRGGPFVLILVCKTNRPCVEKNQHIFYIIFTLIHLLFSWMHVSTCAELCWFWKNMPFHFTFIFTSTISQPCFFFGKQ